MQQRYMVGVILGLGLVSPAFAAAKFLTVVNDDDVSVVRIEAAESGTAAYRPLEVGAPLQGGKLGQGTVAINGPCVVDLKVSYASRAPLTITQWNVCRQPTLYVGKARRAALRQASAVGR